MADFLGVKSTKGKKLQPKDLMPLSTDVKQQRSAKEVAAAIAFQKEIESKQLARLKK